MPDAYIASDPINQASAREFSRYTRGHTNANNHSSGCQTVRLDLYCWKCKQHRELFSRDTHRILDPYWRLWRRFSDSELLMLTRIETGAGDILIRKLRVQIACFQSLLYRDCLQSSFITDASEKSHNIYPSKAGYAAITAGRPNFPLFPPESIIWKKKQITRRIFAW